MKQFTDAAMLEWLRESASPDGVVRSLGLLPGAPTRTTFRERFGSFQRAAELAGLETASQRMERRKAEDKRSREERARSRKKARDAERVKQAAELAERALQREQADRERAERALERRLAVEAQRRAASGGKKRVNRWTEVRRAVALELLEQARRDGSLRERVLTPEDLERLEAERARRASVHPSVGELGLRV